MAAFDLFSHGISADVAGRSSTRLGDKTIHLHMTRAPNAGNWLCPTESDRARLEDMTHRLFPASVAVVVACSPLVVLLTLRVGAVFVAPYVLATFVIVAIGTILRTQANPEYWFFASDIAVAFAIAATVALTGGTQSPMLPLLVVSIVAGAGRNTQRGLFVYAVIVVVASALACQFAINRNMNYADLRFAKLPDRDRIHGDPRHHPHPRGARVPRAFPR